MRQPLDGNIIVTGEFKERAQPGTGLADNTGVRRHIGVDLRASVGTVVKAPGDGVVTARYSGSAGNTLEVRIAGKLWRFMHLSRFNVAMGNTFKEGAILGNSGNSGDVAAHLHVDVRKDGTAWNASLYNFVNYNDVINEANKPKSESKRLYFDPIGQVATFYKVSGGTYKMHIKDSSYNWNVIEDHGNYVIVDSASAGGRCKVYLKYSNTGNVIPGRSVR